LRQLITAWSSIRPNTLAEIQIYQDLIEERRSPFTTTSSSESSKFAAREKVRQALDYCTVAVGNRTECDMAVGESEPDKAADVLLALGVKLAVVKMGGGGVLLASDSERVRIDPVTVDLVCGLGAGDAFGGALVFGLLSQWSLTEIGQFANAAGAYVVGQLSCADDMPTELQVRELISKNSRGLAGSSK